MMCRFLIRIEDGYRDNPYHSRTHAADVLRNLHVIIVRGGLLSLMGSRNGGSGKGGNKPGADFSSKTTTSATPGNSQSLNAGFSSTPSPFNSRGTTVTTGTFALGASSIPNMVAIKRKDALTLLSMYLSAIIHDYDHRGVTNPFLIQDMDPLAVSLFNHRKPKLAHLTVCGRSEPDFQCGFIYGFTLEGAVQ